jgi:hypothetical protein
MIGSVMLHDSAVYSQLRKSDAYKNVERNQEHPKPKCPIIEITNQKANHSQVKPHCSYM